MLSLLLLLPLLAVASEPTDRDAVILVPEHGFVVRDDSAVYDAARESIPVFGGVALPAGHLAHLSGQVLGGTPGPLGLPVNTQVALGPGIPYWATTGQWPRWVPQSRYVLRSRLLLPVMLESFDGRGGIAGRARRLVIDGRVAGGIAWSRDMTPRPAGLEVQLTPSGIDVFEDSHDAMMVYPDLATYNARLDSLAALLPPFEDNYTACFPIANEPDFQTLPSFTTVRGLAVAQKIVYDQTMDLGDAAAAAGRPAAAIAYYEAADALCVQDDVLNDHFEVCVHRLEVDPVGMTAGAFGYATLEPSVSSGDLASSYTFEDLVARFDIDLRDLEIRYRLGGDNCVPRPSVPVDAQRFVDTPWLIEWGTCEDQLLTAFSSDTTEDNLFALDPDPADSERLVATQLTQAQTFLAGLGVDSSHTCDQSFLRNRVRDLLLSETVRVGPMVGNAWDEGHPYTDQAEALTLLFSGFDVGTRTLPYTVDLAAYQPVQSRYDEGLVLRWDTASAPATGTHTHAHNTRWMSDPSFAYDVVTTGLSPEALAPFDMAIHVTADYINQHLQAASAEPAMTGDLAPTWDDFGVTPPAGQVGSDPMPLTGFNLARWAPPLLFLGNDLRLVVKQTMPPFVVIPTDLPGESPPDLPVLLSYGHVEVQLLQAQPSGPDRVVFSIAFDIYDEDLRLSVATGPTDGLVLRANPGQLSTDGVVMENTLAFCPSTVNADLPQFTGACERTMERVLTDTFGPLVEDRLFDILRAVPLPRYFDAQGLTPDPVTVAGQVDRVSVAGFVSFYLDLE